MDRDVRWTGRAATAVLAAGLVVVSSSAGRAPAAATGLPAAPATTATRPALLEPGDAAPRSSPAVATARRGTPVVVRRGDGTLTRVPGTSARSGSGRVLRYGVAVEGGIGVDPASFARDVESVLADDRSWGAGGRASFQRVAQGPLSFRVVLASPSTTDRLCAPLRTRGTFSCATGTTAVVNSRRWLRGAATYAGRLEAYRAYVVNHEVGHALGRGHASCPGRGRPAPVMVQQTKGTGGCVAQPWPFP